MRPVNTKSMFHLLMEQMEKLDRNEIDVNQASAMSKLVGQATNLMTYELKRAALMTSVEFRVEHRNLESKNFDSLPE
tara:strand:+ start:79 stop:309 length:231 start_codon:yes stop_codon:yes gene_type:complete